MTQVSGLHAVDVTEISGSARPAFAALIVEIQQRLSTGEELGLSLFVDVEGDPVVDERIAGPLGADFHIGVPATEVHRVDIEPPPGNFDPSFLDTGSIAYRSLTGPLLDMSEVNSREWRTAEIGAANGLDLRWAQASRCPALRCHGSPTGTSHFGAAGGSMAIMDLGRGMTITYVMNKMGSDILG